MKSSLLLFSLLAVLPPDLAFTSWFESRGVTIEIARQPDGPPWVRGRGELHVAAEKVVAALTDFRHYKELFSPAVKRATVLEEAESSVRMHLLWPYPFPFKNRDAVVRYRREALEARGFRLSWLSDSRPGDPKEGIRIERVAGETRVEPLGPERCRVTYTYLGDLGGSFPAWAREKAWREEPVQYFRAIRRKLGLPDPPAEGKPQS